MPPSPSASVFEALRAELLLRLSGSSEVNAPESEVRLLVFHLLRTFGAPPASLNDLGTAFAALPADAQNHLADAARALAAQRLEGRLLQHLLGVQCFLDHDYAVSAAVLVPRPETEILAAAAIEWARRRMRDKAALRFAELGLGSGVLSCELLSALPGLTGVASERSPEAMEIASINLSNIVGKGWPERLQLREAPAPDSGFEVFLPEAPFDLVVSNPPYLSPADEIEAQVRREEPNAALFAPGSVNHFYESFALHGRTILAAGGRAYLEVPHERAHEIEILFSGRGFRTQLLVDLTGRPRVLALD